MTPGLATDAGGMMTRTVLITVSAAAAYLVLVAGLMAWCRYRRIRRKQQYLRTAAEGTSVLRQSPGGVAGWIGNRRECVGECELQMCLMYGRVGW